MGSRLQALLEQLNALGMKDEYNSYLNTYIRKNCLSMVPEGTTGLCMMQSDCIACQQISDVPTECNEAAKSDNYGGLKKGFLSAEKQNSETQKNEKKCTKSKNGSNSCNGASAKETKIPHKHKRKDADSSKKDVEDRKPVLSIEEKILDGLGFLGRRVGTDNDFKNFLADFATQVAHLLAESHSNLPSLPRNRPPVFTDIIYLKEHQFKEALQQYCDIGRGFVLDTPAGIVSRVLNNRELATITLYMYEFSELYEEEERNVSSEDKLVSRRSIIQGYRALLKKLEIDGYRTSVEKFVKILESISKKDHDFSQGKQFGQLVFCKKVELTVMFKAILKYQDMYRDDETRLYILFSTHPIFKPITALFDMIDMITTELPHHSRY